MARPLLACLFPTLLVACGVAAPAPTTREVLVVPDTRPQLPSAPYGFRFGESVAESERTCATAGRAWTATESGGGRCAGMTSEGRDGSVVTDYSGAPGPLRTVMFDYRPQTAAESTGLVRVVFAELAAYEAPRCEGEEGCLADVEVAPRVDATVACHATCRWRARDGSVTLDVRVVLTGAEARGTEIALILATDEHGREERDPQKQ